jgi:predicted signal transduction protein with EAL and GGDEF domain
MKQNPNENAYDFSIYRLSVSQPGIRIFTTAVAVFNALLLIPDILHLTGRALIAVCVLRSFYSILCVIFAFNLRHFRSFKALSFAVTLAEMMAAGIFLVVFSLYRTPDLLIQILGIMLLILIVFMVPNRFSCMIALSLATALGFLAIAYNLFANADRAQYIAAAIYMAADIAFGAIFALINLKYQRREYASFAELQKLYATDPLTQVGNRIRLEKEAEKWLAFCSRHNLPLSLVIIDIDNMKKINDQHGHLAGDATICELVQTLCPQLRRNDVCVRLGRR